MNENVLSAIYDAYLDNAFEGVQATNYSDLRVAYANLEEFEKKHNISMPEHNILEFDVLSEIASTSERKGFTNGFKLAVRLAFEMYDKTTERA